MGIGDTFQKLGKSWYASRKRLAKKASLAFRSWYSGGGKDQIKVLFSGAFGELWSRYGDPAIGIVEQLRDRKIPLAEGENVSAAFVRVMIDRNKDGKLSLADIPDRYLNRLRETALGIVENVSGDPKVADAATKILEALRDGDEEEA